MPDDGCSIVKPAKCDARPRDLVRYPAVLLVREKPPRGEGCAAMQIWSAIPYQLQVKDRFPFKYPIEARMRASDIARAVLSFLSFQPTVRENELRLVESRTARLQQDQKHGRTHASAPENGTQDQ
jgi:hypothetical protein